MLWRTCTKPDRSKVLNMTEKTFSITLVPNPPTVSMPTQAPESPLPDLRRAAAAGVYARGRGPHRARLGRGVRLP